MKEVAAIVLAAGKGSRMNSEGENKVVLKLDEKPMISYTVENLKKAGIKDVVAVVGFASDSVQLVLGKEVSYAFQKERQGTGHAVKIGLSKVPKEARQVVSVYGDDSAFYPPSLIADLVSNHKESKAAVTLLTIKKTDPTGLGRIVRDGEGKIQAIVEEKNANQEQKEISEINTGLYCFDREFLDENIDKIKKNEVSGEYYLTDLIEMAVEEGLLVKALFWEDDSVWYGINTPDQLEKAKELMKSK